MIKHVLKNGNEIEDITGHEIKDLPELYEILDSMEEAPNEQFISSRR